MERIVFNLKWNFCLSAVVSVLSAIAIEAFGAPLQTVFLAPFALMVVVTLIQWHLEDGRDD